MGPIATYGNENVTKLNEDSPIKIAEQFGETYTNEYRNAYEEMEETGMSLGTEKMTKHLLDVLEVSDKNMKLKNKYTTIQKIHNVFSGHRDVDRT